MKRLPLRFRCGDDTLFGVADVPDAPARRGVLVVVGGPQYRAGSHRQFALLARALAAAGVAVMRFDVRGMGDSEGEPRSFTELHDDVRAAIDAFQDAVPHVEEVVLWGLCDGASAAMLVAAGDARVSGLALLNPWARTDSGAARATLKHYYVDRLLQRGLWRKIAAGHFDVRSALTSLVTLVKSARTPAPQALQASLPDQLHAALSAFQGPVLLMLSGADLTAQEFAGLEHSSPAWRTLLAQARITRRQLPGADHTCSRPEWHCQMVDWTIDWLRH